MAGNMADRFERLVKNLQPDNGSLISSRKQSIVKRINRDIWGIDSGRANARYVGSYGRGTAIRGFSDVDLLVVLPDEWYERYENYSSNGQSALLQAVRASVRRTYPRTDVGGDGQVVVVTFVDGLRFEVLPCFKNRDGSYTHADSNRGGSWKVTNPVAEKQALDEADAESDQKLRRVCRMARAWKQRYDVPMNGLLIDTLAYQFITRSDYSAVSSPHDGYLMRDFLNFLAAQKPSQRHWWAPGSRQYVRRQGSFERQGREAYELASAAIRAEQGRRPVRAAQGWQAIFDPFFGP